MATEDKLSVEKCPVYSTFHIKCANTVRHFKSLIRGDFVHIENNQTEVSIFYLFCELYTLNTNLPNHCDEKHPVNLM